MAIDTSSGKSNNRLLTSVKTCLEMTKLTYSFTTVKQKVFVTILHIKKILDTN